jgi:hypothetical protein
MSFINHALLGHRRVWISNQWCTGRYSKISWTLNSGTEISMAAVSIEVYKSILPLKLERWQAKWIVQVTRFLQDQLYNHQHFVKRYTVNYLHRGQYFWEATNRSWRWQIPCVICMNLLYSIIPYSCHILVLFSHLRLFLPSDFFVFRFSGWNFYLWHAYNMPNLHFVLIDIVMCIPLLGTDSVNTFPASQRAQE